MDKRFHLIVLQIVLLVIAYELAMVPLWQYLIVLGLHMLAFGIGRQK